MTLQELFSKPNSWCQHALRKERRNMETGERTLQCCLEGGIIECYGDGTAAASAAKSAILNAILTVDHGYPYSLPAFNDADGRTIEEIRHVVKVANK